MSTHVSVDTYQSKIDNAHQLVEEFNSAAPDDSKLVWDDILKKLRGLGGISLHTLQNCTWEDLNQHCGVPLILARSMVKLFRAREEPQPASAGQLSDIKLKRVKDRSTNELFQHYTPQKDGNSAVADELNKRAGGRRCVVFNDDGSVNVDHSAMILRNLIGGGPESDITICESRPFKVYHIGVSPNQYVDINPFFPDLVLVNDVCTRSNRSLAKLVPECRELIYIAVTQTHELELKPNSYEQIHTILDFVDFEAVKVDGSNSLARLQARFPRATVHLAGLLQKPNLKVLAPGDVTVSSKPNNPFGSHKTY